MDVHFKSKLLRGSTFSMAGTFLMLAFHFLTMKVLAECMPLTDFGIFALLMVISQGFVVTSGLGLSLTLVKNLSSDAEISKQQEIVTGILVARLAQMLLLSFLAVTLGPIALPKFLGAELTDYIIFLPGIFCLAGLRETLFNILQGRQQFHLYAVAKVLSALTRLLSVLGLMHLDRLAVRELLWVEIVTTSATVLVLLVLTHTTSLFRIASFRLHELKKSLRFSSPLYANDIFSYLYDSLTVILLGSLLSTSSVALFSVATRIPDALGKLFLSMTAVYFPSISQLMASGRRQEGHQLMNLALPLSSLTLTLIGLCTYFFKDQIISILFAQKYAAAAPVLALLMLSFTFKCMGNLMGCTAVATGHASLPLRINIVTSCLNVLACVCLIPSFGLLGAVSAQITANAVGQLVYWQQLHSFKLTVNVKEVVNPILLGLTIVSVYQLADWQHPAIRISLIVLYAMLCWIAIPSVRRFCDYGVQKALEFRNKTDQFEGRSSL